MEIFILAFGLIGLALFTFIVVFFDIRILKENKKTLHKNLSDITSENSGIKIGDYISIFKKDNEYKKFYKGWE